ncbi:MAG: prepilin-type N-terminal cleavage/methylation domain-containing protein [Synergistaceae bacterium]|nr:prepilin-type N-terminal cleavage/methylation domain-containing protein [Synergistaceae bacterium]
MVKKFHGFSLVELLVAVAIILVLAGGIILNINSMKTTPKKEAERVAHFLMTEINKADKRHREIIFAFNSEDKKLEAKINSTSEVVGEMNAGTGFTYNFTPSEIKYNISEDNAITPDKTRFITIKTTNSPANTDFRIAVKGKDVEGKDASYYAVITVSGDTTIE